MVFDTLDHKVLLEKMKCTSFSGNTVKWFRSDLTNKATFVSLGTGFSEAGTIYCRVSHGSILRPMLEENRGLLLLMRFYMAV